MKNKIILNILGIIAVSIFITLIINKNTKEYIMYDGAMLALTIDGEKADSFPDSSKKYHVDVNCENGIGKYQPVKVLDSNGLETDEYEMKFTVEDITGDVVCNIDFTSITDEDLLINEVERANSTYNDGYRYQGKEPDNWVWFNNELWRIIGSVPTCTDATISGSSGTCNQTEDTKPRLVKIIRAESIGGLAYHSADSNTTWGDSNTLYTLLNEYYYGKVNATGSSPCYGYSSTNYGLCNYEENGISNNSTDYYGKMIKNVYMNIGRISVNSTGPVPVSVLSVESSGLGTVIDTAYDLEVATVTKETKIGLMNVSDYGYATSGITYSSVYLALLSAYANTNWIFGQGYEWTMVSAREYYVMRVCNDGNISYENVEIGNMVRPVVYLDPSVYIIDGTGTELDPYIIGM